MNKSKLTIALIATMALGVPVANANEENAGSFVRTAASSLPDTSVDFTKAAENTINCVVSIKSFATPKMNQRSDFFNDPFFEFFFGGNQGRNRQPQQSDATPQPLGLGSGVIISEDGYIVTNNHVIEGAEKLEVTLNDKQVYNATVVGFDATTDLALLKIDASKLNFITFGDSDKVRVGEWVLAVGNPFGFTSTVTAGIVSAKARNVSSVTHSQQMGIESYIQTDAAINQGNSGGALVNIHGELIGINTLIYTRTGDYSGYAFAIPSAIVKKIISDLRQYGTVQRAMLGITFRELTPELCKEKEITDLTEGIYVVKVQDQSAAMEADIKEGDIITEIGGTQVHNSAELQECVSRFSPGDKTTVTFYREGKKKTVNITFRNAQGGTNIQKESDFTALGCTFSKLSQKTKDALHISYGVEVGGIKKGKFKDAGISNGYIIQEINESPVNSQEDVEKLYNAIMRDPSADKVMYIKGVLPTGKRFYTAVPLFDDEE